ncbi:MraY family glycosyltransferase [Streptomyces sp. TRM70350]|uniref:MraY family glycosyltransferase n=1 Tax=Streptomyces sp. TRM70350 TaxID=2856165 RepID=UPI001C481A11|nr:MraY family glycosyltransferase [Streptomyces sp. TRM70350]MBV7696175.1 undecaprenyl/decaprenyl-phosphate alpha-N-acetylglucosaminyl 1-phosphate transferase [Streptomyces sp. TRM70350]
MLYGIAAAVAALFLASVLAALLRGLGLRLGVLDRRRRSRSVPLLGGVAVVLTTLAVAGTGEWTGVAPLGSGVGRLLITAAAVAVLGLVADVWRLRNRVLLCGTAVAAACVVPYEEVGVAGGVVAAGWIAAVAVAFRALDHADALVGTVGVVTAFGVGVCAAVAVLDGLAVLLSVLAAALTGFLMHNWHPARIALGACGSLFTGFVLAAAVVLTRAGYAPGSSAGVLFAFTAVASADVLLVLLARRFTGRPGPDHLAHRLRRLGLTPQGVTVVLGTLAFGGALVGVLVHAGWVGAGAVLGVAGAALILVLGLLRVRTGGRVTATSAHTSASLQVTGHLRVRNG